MQNGIYQAFRHFVAEQGVIFYYHGYLSQPIVAAMGEALRGKLEVEDGSAKLSRKVFSTFVEMMQNIIHYSDGLAEKPGAITPMGNVVVGRVGERYYIVSGNTVASSQVERLRARLEAIRAMSGEEIRAEYRRKLRTDERDENSQGAGLGFLTVAREASEPIDYFFEPFPGMGEALSFFTLKATV